MEIPSAFHKLSLYFHQDVGLDSEPPQEWVDFGRQHLDENERGVVKAFVYELLSGRHDDAELQKLWFSTDAEISFPDGQDLRNFLRLIHDMM